MPEEPNISEHVLRYSTDQASVQQSVGAVDSLKASFKDVGAAVDRATSGLGATGARVLALRQEVKGLADEQRRLEQAWLAGEDATDAFVDATVKLERKRHDLAQAERDLRDEIAGTSEEMRQQRAEADRLLQQRADWEKASLYGDVETSGRAITGAVGFIGGGAGARVERSLNVGAELLATAEAAGRLKQQLPAMTRNLVDGAGGIEQLALKAGTATLAVGAFVAAFQLVKSVLEQDERAAKTWIDANKEVTQVLATGTSDEVREAIRNLQKENQGLILEHERLTEALKEEKERLGDVTSFTRGAFKVGAIHELIKARDAVADQLTSNTEALTQLQAGLADGTTAAADMRAAEEALADKRKEAQEQFLGDEEERFRKQVERDKARRDWSQEQLEQTLSDIEIEKRARQQQRDELLVTGYGPESDPVKAVNDAITALETEANYIQNFIAPVVEAREAEAEAIEHQQEALDTLIAYREDELDAARKATEDAQEAFAKRAELQKEFKAESIALEAERARSILEEEADFARERLRDIRDFNLELADLDQDYLDKRQDLVDAVSETQTEANQAQVDAIKDHQKEDVRLLKAHKQRLLEIEENAERSIEDSAATLSSAGVIAAKERGAQALKEERNRYADARAERDEDFQDLLNQLHLEGQAKVDAARDAVAELDRQHQQERAKREQAFAQKLADEDEDRRLSLQRQREAWKREDDERRDHLNGQLRELKNQQRDALVAARQHYGHLRTATAEGMGRVRDAFTRGLDSLVVSVTRTLTGSTTPAKGYAGGGTPPLGKDVWVGEHGTEWATVGRSLIQLGQGGPERVRFADAATVYRHGTAPTIQLSMPLTVQAGAGGFDTGALQGLLERRIGPMVQRELLGFFGGSS
jgi:hypothetical protein